MHYGGTTHVEVPRATGTYECSGVVKHDDGSRARGYKWATLRTLVDHAGVITQGGLCPMHVHSDLAKSGIRMEIKLLEWNTFITKLDEAQFDAVVLAWSGGSVDLDPKQIWRSSSAVKGGSNIIGYQNPEVDRLIDAARQELDKPKRIPLLQQVYRTIAADAPYAFLFNSRFAFYAHTARLQKVRDTFTYSKPVIDVILARTPISLQFGLLFLILTSVVCVALGVIKALQDGSAEDVLPDFTCSTPTISSRAPLPSVSASHGNPLHRIAPHMRGRTRHPAGPGAAVLLHRKRLLLDGRT